MQSIAHSSALVRFFSATFLIFYLLMPLFYGYATFGLKVMESATFCPSDRHLWNSLLAPHDARKVDDFLHAQAIFPEDIWYLPEPLLALDLQGRQIFGHPLWNSLEAGEPASYTARAVRILALVPHSVTDLDAIRTLRHTFPQSSSWHPQSIPDSNYVLWIGPLNPP